MPVRLKKGDVSLLKMAVSLTLVAIALVSMGSIGVKIYSGFSSEGQTAKSYNAILERLSQVYFNEGGGAYTVGYEGAVPGLEMGKNDIIVLFEENMGQTTMRIEDFRVAQPNQLVAITETYTVEKPQVCGEEKACMCYCTDAEGSEVAAQSGVHEAQHISCEDDRWHCRFIDFNVKGDCSSSEEGEGFTTTVKVDTTCTGGMFLDRSITPLGEDQSHLPSLRVHKSASDEVQLRLVP